MCHGRAGRHRHQDEASGGKYLPVRHGRAWPDRHQDKASGGQYLPVRHGRAWPGHDTFIDACAASIDARAASTFTASTFIDTRADSIASGRGVSRFNGHRDSKPTVRDPASAPLTAASPSGSPRCRPINCGISPAPIRPPASSRPMSPGPETCECFQPNSDNCPHRPRSCDRGGAVP